MNETDHLESSSNPVFAPTHWTLVMRARGDTPESRAALGELCDTYWTPVFRFLCQEGRDGDQARDLAQEFFSRLLSRGGIDGIDPVKGRFRSYLLGALKHFLADVKRSGSRQKRGGDAVMVSIDSGSGTETSPRIQLPDPAATVPDAYFDHQWALAVMEHALGTVQSAFEKAGKENQFDVLKPWLIGDTDNLCQVGAAAQLGLTTGAVKVAIHRMRKRFRDAVQSEIAQTVKIPSEITEELSYLIDVLSQIGTAKCSDAD